MREVREGDRIIITMTPELGYGARERTGIPANSTLVSTTRSSRSRSSPSFAKFMRDGDRRWHGRRGDRERQGDAESEGLLRQRLEPRSAATAANASKPARAKRCSLSA